MQLDIQHDDAFFSRIVCHWVCTCHVFFHRNKLPHLKVSQSDVTLRRWSLRISLRVEDTRWMYPPARKGILPSGKERTNSLMIATLWLDLQYSPIWMPLVPSSIKSWCHLSLSPDSETTTVTCLCFRYDFPLLVAFHHPWVYITAHKNLYHRQGNKDTFATSVFNNVLPAVCWLFVSWFGSSMTNCTSAVDTNSFGEQRPPTRRPRSKHTYESQCRYV